MALRQRRESRRWVQTLRGRGDGVLSRLEHEVPIPIAAGAPAIDVQRHAGTPAGDGLRRALGDDAPPLQALFETHVRRTKRAVRNGQASAEIAFDAGELRAGDARQPACELGFELLQGSPGELIAVARRWLERFPL